MKNSMKAFALVGAVLFGLTGISGQAHAWGLGDLTDAANKAKAKMDAAKEKMDTAKEKVDTAQATKSQAEGIQAQATGLKDEAKGLKDQAHGLREQVGNKVRNKDFADRQTASQ